MEKQYKTKKKIKQTVKGKKKSLNLFHPYLTQKMNNWLREELG